MIHSARIFLSQMIKKIFALEMTVGFETNLNINAQRKKDKYQELLQALNSQFSFVEFVNLSVSCLGIFGRSANSFIDMCKELEINNSYLGVIIRKTSNIIIRSTYFIFLPQNQILELS